MFKTIEKLSVRWKALAVPDYQGDGLCRVDLTGSASGVDARGMVIGSIEGRPFAAKFVAQFDSGWRSRSLIVETTDGRSLDIRSDGEGNWTKGTGEPIPALSGAIDIDLQASPLTNTLPIRRLGLMRSHGPVEFTMAYIPFDTFVPYADGQRYTCVEDRRLYRYENADRTFVAELPVDDYGLVLDYPTLFARVP